MYLESLTEHQIHLFGGIVALAALFFGTLGVLIYLDKRGNKTYSSRPRILTRRERRREEKTAKNKRKRDKNKNNGKHLKRASKSYFGTKKYF